jgi:N utilization substance protein A
MSFNIFEIFNELVKEKSIDRASIHGMVEAGLAAAARKRYGPQANVIVNISESGASLAIFLRKKVVEHVADPVIEISLEEAKAYKEAPQLEEEIDIPLDFAEFGRNAILAAKQVVIQRVREAERDRVLRDYSGRVGEIISGTIQHIERGNFIIFIDKATEAILPQREQLKREHYRQGDNIRACLIEVQDTSKGPQLILSRAHPDFVKALFRNEVPEVSQGIVEIKVISREAGSRTKVAVQSRDPNVDPLGACVGLKGSRVTAIVNELGGERIDIIPFSEDASIFVRRALSPAIIQRTIPIEEGKKMTVIVAEDQLSRAIGKNGENVRLASKLTGWEIDLLTPKEFEEREAKKEEGELISLEEYELTRIPGIGERTAEQLAVAGYKTLADLLNIEEEDLLKVPGIGKKTAEKLIAIITNLSDELAIEEEEVELVAPVTEGVEGEEIPEETEGPPKEPEIESAGSEVEQVQISEDTGGGEGEREAEPEEKTWAEEILEEQPGEEESPEELKTGLEETGREEGPGGEDQDGGGAERNKEESSREIN